MQRYVCKVLTLKWSHDYRSDIPSSCLKGNANEQHRNLANKMNGSRPYLEIVNLTPKYIHKRIKASINQVHAKGYIEHIGPRCKVQSYCAESLLSLLLLQSNAVDWPTGSKRTSFSSVTTRQQQDCQHR